MSTNHFPIAICYPLDIEADSGDNFTTTTHRRPSLPHLPHMDPEAFPPLTVDTCCHRRSESDGSLETPRNFALPSPLTVFQHIRRSSSVGSNEYNYTPPSTEGSSSRSNSIGSVSDRSVTPPSQPEPSSPQTTYFWPTNPTSAAALKRAQSLGSNAFHNCDESCLCTRHHHRRNSVAIKFSPTYLEDPFYEDEVTKLHRKGQSEMQVRNDAYGRAIRRHSTSSLHRPPTPIAERILKGDFTF